MTPTNLVQVRFDTTPEQKAALDALADRQGVPMTRLLRDAVHRLTGVPFVSRTAHYRRGPWTARRRERVEEVE